MEKNTRIPLLGLIFLALLLSLAFVSEPCAATEVLSENFDDLDGWTTYGYATSIDGCLRATDRASVSHPCNVSVGTWSFEARDMGVWHAPRPGLWFHFVSMAGMSYTFIIKHSSSDAGKQYQYSLWGHYTGRMAIYYGLEGSAAELRGTLHAINITRTEAGDMSVYLNGSRILSGTDTQITSSASIFIDLAYDWAIDSLVVDDTPIDSFVVPLELVAVGAGAVAIVVVVLAILKRRR